MNEIPSPRLRIIHNPFTTNYRDTLFHLTRMIDDNKYIILSGEEVNVHILLGEFFLITGKQYEAITFGKHYLVREK